MKFAGTLISNLAPSPSVPLQVSTLVEDVVQVRSAACATDGVVTANAATSAVETRPTRPFLTNVFFISYLVSRSLELFYEHKLRQLQHLMLNQLCKAKLFHQMASTHPWHLIDQTSNRCNQHGWWLSN